MSRLARNPVPVPSAVTVEVNGQDVKAKGPKGEMSYSVHPQVTVALLDGEEGKLLKVDPTKKSQDVLAQWGTSWAQLRNLMTGVNDGFVKELEIVGVGYRANVQGQDLVLSLGFSHEVRYPIPQGITITVEQNTQVKIEGIDKQVVGQVSAEIRGHRPPEPYKGKGVRYKDEYILRKEGKKK